MAATATSVVHFTSAITSSPPPVPPFSTSTSQLRFLPSFSAPTIHSSRRRNCLVFGAKKRSLVVVSALKKLSETELVPISEESEGFDERISEGSGIYGVYDSSGDLQFIGITRNIAGSIAVHRKTVPELCYSVKVGLIDEPAPDREILTNAWKSWLQEHIETTGRVPPGNEAGNNTWLHRPQKKPDLRLTPGRNTKLTVPLVELIDRLVKENRVVTFIKGSRSSPQCGFSQRVVGILESQGVDFECVNVLDEEYNSGLRETLKTYSNWPTFPQIFVKGELLGGCDILSAMEEKGELGVLFEK